MTEGVQEQTASNNVEQPEVVYKGLRLRAKAIPPAEHRYATVGDWWEKDGVWELRVSQMTDWRYEFLVALHEMVEMALCKAHEVKEEDVMAFDIAFESARGKNDDREPGDDRKAPYRSEHAFATTIEKMVAASMGVDWAVYDRAVGEL